MQYDATVDVGAERLHLLIQVDPFLGRRVYPLTAPLDPNHPPPAGSHLAFATARIASPPGASPPAGVTSPGWGSLPGGGSIEVDADSGSISGSLISSDGRSSLQVEGRFSCQGAA